MEKTKTSSSVLSIKSLKATKMVVRALDHNVRKNIINLLVDSDEMNVTDIYIRLRLDQSSASQHIAILRKANIITPERRGKFIYYSISDKFKDFQNKIDKFVA